eukprot:25068-Rhodomonas_salina.2
MSGTDIAYGATVLPTRCLVLMWRTVLRRQSHRRMSMAASPHSPVLVYPTLLRMQYCCTLLCYKCGYAATSLMAMCGTDLRYGECVSILLR